LERVGMSVDVAVCQDVAKRLGVARSRERVGIRKALEELKVDATDFNIDSPDQLADVLESLGAPLSKRTEKKGRLVVDAPALLTLLDAEWEPALIRPILDYRKYVKLITYVTGFVALRGPDGRLHTSFNQSGHWEERGGDTDKRAPSTGRLSSSGPNLQNIPHHRATVGEVDWGKELRRCLVASPGNVLLSADLGQEEPRIIAIIAEDDTLKRGFDEGRDIYRPATEALYPHTVSDDTDVEFGREYEYERYIGKQFFLAWYYGAGAGRLRILDPNLGPTQVKRGLELLNAAHPARTTYLEDTRQQLLRSGYVITLHGRKGRFTKCWSYSRRDRDEALREAANMRVQGTAADILKLALRRIHDDLAKQGLRATLVCTVHDEVVLDVPRDEIRVVKDIVGRAFRDLLSGLPLTIETYVGETWGERERI
jgi:DNA polymerase-1